MSHLLERIIVHETSTGERINYTWFFVYICVMLTIIVLLLAREFGWI